MNSCDINKSSFISSSLSIPDSSLTISKITNLNTCLNSLSNKIQDNLSGSNNVSILNGCINLSSSIATTNGSLTNLDVTGNFTAANFNLGNLSTLEIGSVRIGTLINTINVASFGSDVVGNTDETYAIRQNSNGATYVNGYNSAVRIRNSNVDMASFSYSGLYTEFEFKLYPKNETNASTRIKLHDQLDGPWAIEVFTNLLRFKFSDNVIKFSISKDGDCESKRDVIAEKCVEAGNPRIGKNESFNMASFGHKSFANTHQYYAFGQSSNGQSIINDPTNNSISFRINNTDQIRLTSSGFLGIGTENPQAKLHIITSSNYSDIYLGGPLGVEKVGIIKYIQGTGPGTGKLKFGHYGNPVGFVFSCDGSCSNNGNYACYGQFNAATNIVCGSEFYAPTVYIGAGFYGSGYGSICKIGFETDEGKYALLQDTGATTSLNGHQRIDFKINNNLRFYMNDSLLFFHSGFSIDSDDKLKYEEQDISGLKTIRQLNPKKYIKIPVPVVKKRRKYYDENDIPLVDNVHVAG